MIDGRALGLPPAQDESRELDALVDGEVADDVVAVGREGLSNASRHSGAAVIYVTVAVADTYVSVTASDNGIGIPARVSGRRGWRTWRHGHAGTAGPSC